MKLQFLVCILLLLSAPLPAQPVGKVLPDFEFRTLDSKAVTLYGLRDQTPGGVVLLTFWCTNCSSCRSTEGTLAMLTRKYGSKAKIVAVSSSKNDDVESVKAFLKKNGVRIQVLMDPSSDFARYLNVTRTTTTAILDSDGKLRYFGTFKRGHDFHAKEPLLAVLAGKKVEQPVGPLYG